VTIKREVEGQTSIVLYAIRYLLNKIGINVKAKTHRFVDFFVGFDNVEIVTRIFGCETVDILNDLRVEFVSRIGYMGVNDMDGTIIISADYLTNGDLRDIYLDVIHELVHVKQFREGRSLFDRRYKYIERATEIEAYRYAVEEARNIGMTDAEIFEYLKTEWMSRESHMRLAGTLKVEFKD
jgi:hypothetical protein